MPSQPEERIRKIKDYFNNEGLYYYGELIRSDYPKFDNKNKVYNIMAGRLKNLDKDDIIEIIEMLESIINKREKSKQ